MSRQIESKEQLPMQRVSQQEVQRESGTHCARRPILRLFESTRAATQLFDDENIVDITGEMKDTVDRIATIELAATTLQIWNAVNAHFYFAHQFGPETSLTGVSLCEFYLHHSTR
jgi:hypothetical protein